MFTDVVRVVANEGGLIGLVVLGLLVLVAYLVSTVASLLNHVLKITQENDSRLIDLKKSLYAAYKLPDRRGSNRDDST